MNFDTLTIREAREMLDAREITAVELAKHYVDRANEKNAELNAYLEIFDDVHEQAKHADALLAAGDGSALTGIPLAIKDNILIKGRIASSASNILANYVASYDAHVIGKLKAHGAVFIGRTNMDEFALGSSTENSAYGPTRNPHDSTRIPGGTSGGSAAAVAGGLALGALGTDTGGSVRQPAALCGVVGYKPTYGAVSRNGVMAAASSLDQVGVLAKNMYDAQILFEAIRGLDEKDSTSLPDSFFSAATKPKRIGVPRDFLKSGVDEDVLALFEQSLEALKSKGHEIVEIDMPELAHSLAVYYIINPAEVSTNLARYDGMRYGVPVAGENLIDDYAQTRGKGFGAESRRRILIGTFVLSSGYADAYYRKAAMVREQIREGFRTVFKDVDVIVTPTTPAPAFKIGEKVKDPLAMYAADIFTVPVNLTGVPAVSLPMGTVERDGVQLPVGFQCIAPYGADSSLFVLGSEFESMS